jgi:VWFA-related protein
MASRLRLLAAVAFVVAALASAQGFRENVRVGLIAIRLDVLDRDGRPLPELKASEIRLRVDGKDVPIEGLDRVGGSSAAKDAGSLPAEPPVSAAAPSPQGGATAPSASGGSDLYLAILLDETATNPLDRRDVYRQMEGFLKDRVAPGTHVMLERYDGRLRLECPWTTDFNEALTAARKMGKRMAMSQVPSPSGLQDEIRNGRKARDVSMQLELHGKRSFDGVVQALLRFPEVSGRKGLVLITDGTPFITPFDLSVMLGDVAATSRDDRSLRAEALRAAGEKSAAAQIEAMLRDEALATFTESGASENSTWVRRMARITNKALELDIAFYPIDSEAIARGTNPETGSKWPGRSMPGVTGGSALPVAGSGMTARVPVLESMTTLAETTGGEAILTPERISDRLGAIVAARGSGFLLTFRDPSPGDFRFHKVEIAIDHPGAKVSYRRGYRTRNDDERTLDAIIGHLEEPSRDNPLNLRASFDVLRKEGGRNFVQLKLEYSPAEAPGSETKERDAQIWAICSDDQGNRAAPIRRKAKAQRTADPKAASYADAFQLGLPPGPYTWSIALKDGPTGVTSFVVVKKTF